MEDLIFALAILAFIFGPILKKIAEQVKKAQSPPQEGRQPSSSAASPPRSLEGRLRDFFEQANEVQEASPFPTAPPPVTPTPPPVVAQPVYSAPATPKPKTKTRAPQPPPRRRRRRHRITFSPRVMGRVVVYSEIYGPPMALRPPRERSW